MAFSSEIEKLERRWQENPLGLTFASLAELYRKAGETARALELIEQGLVQHPNYVPAHIVRARCHLDAQSDPDAEQAFLRVTELDPENVMALKGLAELSERAGRIPEAVHRLELLLDVDRNNEEARGQLDRVKELLANAAAAAPAPVENAAPPAPKPPIAAVAPMPETLPEPMAEPIPELEAEAPLTSASPSPEPVGSFDDSSLSDLELEVATQLTSATAHDYQIPNDSESLTSSDDRISDIVLGTEPPEDFPIHEGAYGGESPSLSANSPASADSVDVLLGEEYASLMSYRDVSSVPPVEPPAVEETVFGQMALMADMPGSDPDVLPPLPSMSSEQQSFMPPPPEPEPVATMESVAAAEANAEAAEPFEAQLEQPMSPAEEPAPAWEPMREPDPAPAAESAAYPVAEPETAREPAAAMPDAEPVEMVDDYVPLGDLGAPSRYQPAAPQPSEDSEPAAADEPELVVTETMAEIFLRQGHRELALAVYAQLAQRDPENERIAEALARLSPEVVTEPEPARAPTPRFAASETGGRSVGQLFGALLAAARPAVAQTIHPPAFEPPKRASGEPTRPAQESLSLSSVFGEEAASGGPGRASADSNAGEPSFDEFFAPATGPASDVELPRSPESDSAGAPAQVPEDLEQFNAWLRGLKR